MVWHTVVGEAYMPPHRRFVRTMGAGGLLATTTTVLHCKFARFEKIMGVGV